MPFLQCIKVQKMGSSSCKLIYDKITYLQETSVKTPKIAKLNGKILDNKMIKRGKWENMIKMGNQVELENWERGGNEKIGGKWVNKGKMGNQRMIENQGKMEAN